jgi:hypothetical protein
MHTPIAIESRIFGIHQEMFCLNAGGQLELIWRGEDDAFLDYTSIIGSRDRLLVTTIQGELLLISCDPGQFRLLDRLALEQSDVQVLSHPALVGHQFYIRLGDTVACLALDGDR